MGNKLITPHTTRVPRKCNAECYQTRIEPILNKKHVSQSNLRVTSLCLTYVLYLNMIPLLDGFFRKLTYFLEVLRDWYICFSDAGCSVNKI